MATKIRLARHGRKRKPIYSIVIADSKAPRDGRFIEKIGTYNPNVHPAQITLHENKALHWIMSGAQPSDTVRTVLSRTGVMLRKHLQVGVDKGALKQEDADKKYQEWKKERESTLGHSLFLSKDTVDADYIAPAKPEVAPEPKAQPKVEEVVEEVAEEVVAEAEETTTEEAPASEEEKTEE